MTDHEAREIECTWRQITNIGPEVKSGRYSGCFHWEIPGFGKEKWIVLGYLECDWVNEKEVIGRSEESIIAGCLAYLNKIPDTKTPQKKEPKPTYGKLEPYKADFKIGKDGKQFIIAQFVTNEDDNENFWGEGPVSRAYVSPRKMKAIKTTPTTIETKENGL